MVTDAMLGLSLAHIANFALLFSSKERWMRLIGGAAMILLGILGYYIEDSIIMFSLAGICLIVGGVHIFNETSKMIG